MHKVVVIGVGSIGERHVRCFQGTGRATVSIVEINDTLRATVAGRYGVAAHASLESALQERPGVAVVAAPAHLHIPLTGQLVSAGVHVLIEKPLSVSLEGIAELRQQITERGAVVGLAYVYRANPVLRAMKEALDADRIGRPLELVAVCGQHFPTYRPAYREIYYARRELGGGAIQDALTHVVNAGEWLVGPVAALVADADHCALAGVAVEDTVHLLTRQRNVLGSYSLNQHQAPNELTLTIIGERGTLRWENERNRLSWMNAPGEKWHEQQFAPLERDSLFVSQAHAFLDAVEGRQPVLCSFDEGVQTLRVNLATLASVDQRCWQTVPAG
jgi:predicted dehydrogenase